MVPSRLPDLAVHVLEVMRSNAVEVNSIHVSAVVAAAARCGQWMLALQLLRSSELSREPSVFAWNAAITACEAGDEWERALLLLDSMPAASITPDHVSMNAAISACKKGSNWLLATNFLRSFDGDVVSYGTAISACEKCGMWESALVLAQEMQAGRISLDLVSYNATMSACEKGQAWQYALGLLFQMPSLRLLPDVVSFNAAIVACEQGSKWELAPSLLTVMADSQVPPDLLTYNSMITAYVSGVQWEMALSTLTEASSHSFKPNTISFSAAITACEKGCQWEMALDVLQGMPQAMALPNLVSFNAAISACEKGWRWEEAVAIFQRLPEKSLVPDLISYNAVISACEKGAQWKMALHLLFRMDEGQLFPDEISFNSATIACEKAGAWQAAFHILEHMLVLQLLPDAVFAGSATSALRAARGPVKATHFLRSLRRFWQPCYAQPPDSQAIVAKGAGVIAIFKPAGVTTEDFVAPLREQSQPVDVLQIVSRLDHPTSGVLPLAVGTAGSMEANWLRGQFAGRLVFKEYLCLCEGPALGEAGVEGTIDAPLLTKEIDGVSRSEVSEVFGREAITKYTVVARYRPKQPAAQEATDREVMLLAVRPKTGRTHQIRVHMASIDCPLAGDLTYGFRAQNSSVRCPRLFLHCRRIQLLDINDDVFSAEAQLPRELTEVIETLDPLG